MLENSSTIGWDDIEKIGWDDIEKIGWDDIWKNSKESNVGGIYEEWIWQEVEIAENLHTWAAI